MNADSPSLSSSCSSPCVCILANTISYHTQHELAALRGPPGILLTMHPSLGQPVMVTRSVALVLDLFEQEGYTLEMQYESNNMRRLVFKQAANP